MFKWLIPLILLAAPAAAQERPANCAAYEEWERRFASNAMTAKEFAIVDNGVAMQLWSNHEGDWGMLFFSPDGIACLIAKGEGWRVLKPHSVEKPA